MTLCEWEMCVRIIYQLETESNSILISQSFQSLIEKINIRYREMCDINYNYVFLSTYLRCVFPLVIPFCSKFLLYIHICLYFQGV